MKAHLLCIAALCALTASPGRAEDAAFDPKAAAFIHKEGKATIEGHAFLKKPDGAVANAVGETVRLVPVTPYSEARFARFYGPSKFIAARAIPKFEADPDYASYTRTVKSESSGRFTFDKVAPGKYFVATQIIYKAKHSFFPEGGALYDTVTVTGKEAKAIKLVLSGP
jgi:hypothetical protein